MAEPVALQGCRAEVRRLRYELAEVRASRSPSPKTAEPLTPTTPEPLTPEPSRPISFEVPRPDRLRSWQRLGATQDLWPYFVPSELSLVPGLDDDPQAPPLPMPRQGPLTDSALIGAVTDQIAGDYAHLHSLTPPLPSYTSLGKQMTGVRCSLCDRSLAQLRGGVLPLLARCARCAQLFHEACLSSPEFACPTCRGRVVGFDQVPYDHAQFLAMLHVARAAQRRRKVQKEAAQLRRALLPRA